MCENRTQDQGKTNVSYVQALALEQKPVIVN